MFHSTKNNKYSQKLHSGLDNNIPLEINPPKYQEETTKEEDQEPSNLIKKI